MEGPLVETRTQRRFGFGAQAADGQFTQLVGRAPGPAS